MQDHSPDHNSDSNASVLDPSMDKHEEQAAAPIDAPEWKPGYRFKLAFAALAVLAIMVSLDGTSVSVALPVSEGPRSADPFPGVPPDLT